MSRFTHLATTSVEVSRNDHTSIGHGVFVDTPVVMIAALAARVAPAGARELTIAERMNVKATHVLYTEPDAAVRVLDELRELAGLHAGRRFRVTGLLPPSVPHHLKALLEETQQAGTV